MRVKEISVGLGVTVCINNVYYKPTAELKIEVDISYEKDKRLLAYRQGYNELEKQLEMQIQKIAQNNQ